MAYAMNVADWQDWTVTKVEAFLHVTAFQQGEIGTIRLGSYYGGPDDILHRTDVSQWPVGTGRWVDITPWGRHLLANNPRMNGLAIGPGERAAGVQVDVAHDAANMPKIRATGYRWVTGPIAERMSP
jgi:hypothetical protein